MKVHSSCTLEFAIHLFSTCGPCILVAQVRSCGQVVSTCYVDSKRVVDSVVMDQLLKVVCFVLSIIVIIMDVREEAALAARKAWEVWVARVAFICT